MQQQLPFFEILIAAFASFLFDGDEMQQQEEVTRQSWPVSQDITKLKCMVLFVLRLSDKAAVYTA